MSKIAKAQGRDVEEWIGKNPMSVPPPRVLLRIWRRQNGLCHLTGRKIMPGDKRELDHIVRLEDGGANRESNLAYALTAPHKIKSAEERERAARADAQARAHLNIKDASRRPIRSAGFVKYERTPKRLSAEKRVLGQSGLMRQYQEQPE